MAAEGARAEPRLARPLTLHFAGDWGQANLHRVCGWLAQEVWDRTGTGSRLAIWSSRGGADAVHAIGRGEVDMALTTPAAFAAAALDGRPPYTGTSYPHLRALGSVPQRDRLVFALDAGLGVGSFAELRARRLPLRLTTGPNDGGNNIGLAAHRLLGLLGLSADTLASWGGSVLEFERPDACLRAMHEGRANAVFQEAIMTPWWREVADARALRFLPIEAAALETVERESGWPRATLPAGYLRGLDADLETLDFSDFLLLVREDMPDDVAYLLAWCLGETREVLERQYRHIPPERSPVTYPLDPPTMARTPVPLHAAAARYYREYGYL